MQGIVTDSLSTPVPGAIIGVLLNNIIVATTSTATNGGYSISGLAPDSYTINVAATGYCISRLGFSVSSGQTVTENFVMQPNPGSLTGTITDATTTVPVSGATIDIIQGTGIVTSSQSASDGTYSIQGLAPASYTVRVTQGGYQIAVQGAIIYQNLQTTSDFALLSNPGTIDGTISDVDTGIPIPGATINLIQGATLIATVLTDDNGQYIAASLPPGQYVVQAIASGYGTRNMGADLT